MNLLLLDKKPLGWVDRRCRQKTGRFDLPCGIIAIISVGDIGHFPSVMDKTISQMHCITKNLTNKVKHKQFVIYQLFDKVVNLTKNEIFKGENDEQKQVGERVKNLWAEKRFR